MAKAASDMIQEITDRIGDLEDEAAAIVAAAAEDGRDFTEDEKARYDELTGTAGDDESGLIAAEHRNLNRWEGIQAQQAKSKQRRTDAAQRMLDRGREELKDHAVPQHGGVYAFGCNSEKRFQIPAVARRHRKLHPAWEGNEHNAYAGGMFFLAAIFDWDPAREFCQSNGVPLIRDQQEVGTPGKGGYLAPTELERTIIQIREQYGVLRRHARIYPMASETKDLPKDMNGIVVAPAAEGADIEASNSTSKDWTRPQLVAGKWAGYTDWTSELDESAIIDIGNDLAIDYARAFAFAEDNAGFNGDGTGAFNNITGVKNALQASSTIKLAGTEVAITDITVDHYLAMIGKTPNSNAAEDGEAWYCHKTVWAQSILPLVQAGGGNTIRDLEMGAMTQPGGTGDRPNFFWQGYPGYFLNAGVKASDLAADVKGVVYFGNLRGSVAFGDKRNVTIAVSEHYKFNEDRIALRGTERFDISVHETGTATPSDPAGAMVQLEMGAAT